MREEPSTLSSAVGQQGALQEQGALHQSSVPSILLLQPTTMGPLQLCVLPQGPSLSPPGLARLSLDSQLLSVSGETASHPDWEHFPVTPVGPCSSSRPQSHLLPPVRTACDTLFLTTSPEERTAGRPPMLPEKLQAESGLKATQQVPQKGSQYADFAETRIPRLGGMCARGAGLPLWN